MTQELVIKETVKADNPPRVAYLITNQDEWRCVSFQTREIRDATFDEHPTWESMMASHLIPVDRDTYGDPCDE